MNRRDFLKLMGLLPAGYTISHFVGEAQRTSAQTTQQNVLIILFDALSAHHVSLHGYRRDTMPQLTQLAEKAVVFHQHYAGGPYTSPATAAFLTGTLPWTNRVFRFNATVQPDRAQHNIFNAFSDYHRIAYSHNPLVNTLFKQFEDDMDGFKNRQDLFLTKDILTGKLFARDYVIANQSRRELLSKEDGIAGSLFLSDLFTKMTGSARGKILAELQDEFPRGLPSLEDDNYFLLEDAINWIQSQITTIPQPYLGYFHLWPPHNPYNTRAKYVDIFAGTHAFPDKPKHLLATENLSQRQMKIRRQHYDEFIPYVDDEFARLYAFMEDQGMLENTWLVLTADHGEMFERGLSGHFHRLLHEPVTRIPLMIFPPGQGERIDIQAPTSAVDLLPTLLNVTGHETPTWAEGKVLPPFGNPLHFDQRPVFTVEAKDNPQYQPFTEGTFSMVQWPYKVIYYLGYGELAEMGGELIEVYNLETDPDEMENIFDNESQIMTALAQKLKNKLDEVNAPYR